VGQDLVICDRCGNVINPNDPRVKRLSPTTAEVWHSLESEFKRHKVLGVIDVAKTVGCSKSTAHYHLQRLRIVELVTPVIIREGGTYKRYRAA
jgi:predicted ArsR family transcriptional regulator